MICKHKSTKINSFHYCYRLLTIQLNISHLLTHMLNDIKQFHFHQLNLACHLFALSLTALRTLVMVESYSFADMQSVYSTDPADWALHMRCV